MDLIEVVQNRNVLADNFFFAIASTPFPPKIILFLSVYILRKHL